jgi:hypothetical protein
MPMKLIDLRLPDEAIQLLDTLKHRYPPIQGRHSRTSVLIHILAAQTPQTRQEAEHQDALRTWTTQHHPQQPDNT